MPSALKSWIIFTSPAFCWSRVNGGTWRVISCWALSSTTPLGSPSSLWTIVPAAGSGVPLRISAIFKA